MPAPDINQLVHGFAEHICELKSPTTTEATVRQNYIDPFWRALSRDIGDTKQLGPAEAEVIIEKCTDTVEGPRRKRTVLPTCPRSAISPKPQPRTGRTKPAQGNALIVPHK